MGKRRYLYSGKFRLSCVMCRYRHLLQESCRSRHFSQQRYCPCPGNISKGVWKSRLPQQSDISQWSRYAIFGICFSYASPRAWRDAILFKSRHSAWQCRGGSLLQHHETGGDFSQLLSFIGRTGGDGCRLHWLLQYDAATPETSQPLTCSVWGNLFCQGDKSNRLKFSLEGWSRVHARIFPREETAVDRRSGNALDMESDGFPLRNKKRNFDRGQIPVFKIPLPLQMVGAARFELATSCSQSKRATNCAMPRLNHRQSNITAPCSFYKFKINLFLFSFHWRGAAA